MAQQLIDEGKALTFIEAKAMLEEERKHRGPLDVCKDASTRYIDQLKPAEFQGLFRTLFDEVT